jgi:hypothetical protein
MPLAVSSGLLDAVRTLLCTASHGPGYLNLFGLLHVGFTESVVEELSIMPNLKHFTSKEDLLKLHFLTDQCYEQYGDQIRECIERHCRAKAPKKRKRHPEEGSVRPLRGYFLRSVAGLHKESEPSQITMCRNADNADCIYVYSSSLSLSLPSSSSPSRTRSLMDNFCNICRSHE